MAFDVITGKEFTPQFKGQRTAQEINFDPAAWQEAWQTGTQGDVEAQAMADIRAALEQRYAGQDYWATTDQQMAQGGRPGAATPMTREVESIFSQLMGGYNPNIDYAAAGAMPNVFMRSGAGLGDWRAVDAAGLTGTQPTLHGVDYNVVPQINPATVTAPPPAAVAPAAPVASTRQVTSATQPATTAATSVTQPAAATAAAAEVDPAIAQREIIEKALAAKLKPIQNALAAGLLDVQAAQLAWDSARSEIYGDFLTEQTGIQQGFQTQQQADEAKRLAGRTKLLQDLNAAGVDSGMVADELALIDAIAEGSGQERMGLIGDMGRIGLMSDADRRMMGEGIFGGHRQTLQSQARQATLAAELDAVGQIQTAEERALSAGRLSDYMGIPADALMADLYSDIDLTGMATGREQMDWGTSERLGSQGWQTGERIGTQHWQAGENVLNRAFTTSEREAVEEFTTDERVASQTWARDERIDSEDWQSAEALAGRVFTTSERVAIEAFNSGQADLDRALVTSERVASQTWQGGESALDRALVTSERLGAETYSDLVREDVQTWEEGQSALDRALVTDEGALDRALQQGESALDRALVSSERVAGQTWQAGESLLERTFAAAQAELGREFSTDEREAIQAFNRQERLGSEGFAAGESASDRNWQSVWNAANLGVQRDELALRTAAQEEAIRQFGVGEEQWQAAFDQSGDQFTTGQENWQASFDQGADQFTAGQLAQGIDTRQTITRPNYQTGAMETVANPNYGRPIGFDPVSGLTAGEQGDQAYRDAMLAADEAAAETQANQWQSQFDAGMMGVDTREYIPGPEIGAGGQNIMIQNPTYGMSPAQQADYAMDLWTMTQTGTGESDATSNLMNHLATLGDPAFTSAALTEIHTVINNSEALVSKGLSENNILYALGSLSNTQGEPDAQGNPTYPYRDMFLAVQQGSGATGSGGGGTTGAGGTTTQAIEDAAAAAAAAGGGGATFIPGGGQFGIDTVVAPVPAGQQPANASQSSYYYEEGSPISFYLNDGRPVYEDSDGKTYVVRDKSEKYVKEGDKAWEFSYRWVPQRVYRGDGSYWPADQEWPNPIRQG